MLTRGRAAGGAKSVFRAVGVAAGSLGLVATLLVTPAAAAPNDPPLTVDDAKAQVNQLETDAAAIDQQYVAVQEQIADSKAKLKLKQADVKAQTAKVVQMRQQVGQVALAQFQNRSINTTARLFLTEDTDGFLNQVSTVEKVSQNQNSALQDYQSEQAELASLERSTATDVAELEEQQQSLTALRKQSEDKVTQAKALLSKLTEEERQRIAAEEARQTAAAQKAAEEAAAQNNGTGSSSTTSTTTSTGSTAVAGSGRVAKILAFAKAQIGKPYVFSAAGPNAYDCSGLTKAAYAAAGISIPRTSQEQYTVGTPVSQADLQPGDLVFFYSGITHVGIYVGNGAIIHAPNPSKTVEYSKLSYMPFEGARRPG